MQFCIWISVILATIFLLHTQVEASTAMQIVPANPNYPGKCYDEGTSAAYAIGETWSKSGQCVEYRCSSGPENNFLININGCSPVAAEPPCRVVSGNSAEPYPKCCQKIVCD